MSLHILCLEDDDGDWELMKKTLAADGLDCRFEQVQTGADFEAMLKRGGFDLIISDYSLPAYNGASALAAAKKLQPETPFILLSGTVGEERAVEFLKSGATDCVLKQNLARLAPAVRRALEEAEERSRRQRAETALRTQANELRALAGRLQASREEERIRISRELHDELGEMLTGQKFGLVWIKQQLDDAARPVPRDAIIAKVNSLSALVDETAQRMRRLCMDLRPSVLDDLGLSTAIEWQTREFETRTGIKCDLVLKAGSLEVDGQVATAVFRIYQEILTNVARHAQASKVCGELKVAGRNLVLRVKDNGTGISKNKINGNSGASFGLLGMRERAVLLGGTVAIRGVLGKGTTVTAMIPLVLSPSLSAKKANLAYD